MGCLVVVGFYGSFEDLVWWVFVVGVGIGCFNFGLFGWCILGYVMFVCIVVVG